MNIPRIRTIIVYLLFDSLKIVLSNREVFSINEPTHDFSTRWCCKRSFIVIDRFVFEENWECELMCWIVSEKIVFIQNVMVAWFINLEKQSGHCQGTWPIWVTVDNVQFEIEVFSVDLVFRRGVPMKLQRFVCFSCSITQVCYGGLIYVCGC